MPIILQTIHPEMKVIRLEEDMSSTELQADSSRLEYSEGLQRKSSDPAD